MATTYTKRPTLTSPKGVFQWPSLSKPDYGTDAFPNPDGAFKVSLVVPAADAQPLIDKLMPDYQAALVEGKAKFAELKVEQRRKLKSLQEQIFFSEEFDKETEEPTGNVIFKFKTKYKILDKKTNEVRFNKVGLFDAKGKPLPPGVLVYSGTVGKIAFQASPYWIAGQGTAGLTLRLSAAQIIELVGPGARSATSYGFGEEEGFEAGEVAAFSGTEDDGSGSAQAANGNPQDF